MRLLRVNPFSPPRRAHESRQRKSRNVHSVARVMANLPVIELFRCTNGRTK